MRKHGTYFNRQHHDSQSSRCVDVHLKVVHHRRVTALREEYKPVGYDLYNILMFFKLAHCCFDMCERPSTGFLLQHVCISQARHDGHLSLSEKRVSSDDLVVSEGHAAAHTLLYTHVSRVTVPLATGLRDHLIGAEEPEEALLKVLRATYTTAIELYRNTMGGNSRW